MTLAQRCGHRQVKSTGSPEKRTAPQGVRLRGRSSLRPGEVLLYASEGTGAQAEVKTEPCRRPGRYRLGWFDCASGDLQKPSRGLQEPFLRAFRRQVSSRPRGVHRGIRSRCQTKVKHAGTKNYADRGLTVCQGWSLFENFYANLGPRPSSSHSVDRIDNEGGYWCGRCVECLALGRKLNCRWATRAEQANNTRNSRLLTLDGVTKTMTEWSKQAQVGFSCFRGRLEDGWPLAKALTTPARRAGHSWQMTSEKDSKCSVCQLERHKKPSGGNSYSINGKTFWPREQVVCSPQLVNTSYKRPKVFKSPPASRWHPILITAFGETLRLSEWARRTGLNGGTIRQRILSGWDPEKVLTTKDGRRRN